MIALSGIIHAQLPVGRPVIAFLLEMIRTDFADVFQIVIKAAKKLSQRRTARLHPYKDEMANCLQFIGFQRELKLIRLIETETLLVQRNTNRFSGAIIGPAVIRALQDAVALAALDLRETVRADIAEGLQFTAEILHHDRMRADLRGNEVLVVLQVMHKTDAQP